jgi:hypothetical protein
MEKSTKITKIVLWVLFGISIVYFILLLTSIENQVNPGAKAEKLIFFGIYWTEILTVAGTAIALFYAMKGMFSDKKSALNSVSILAGFALVIIISYIASPAEIPQFFGVEKFVNDGSLTPSISRWISAGLVTTYILASLAALLVVGFSALKIFKRS